MSVVNLCPGLPIYALGRDANEAVDNQDKFDELGLYDNYVIPLANKVKQCGMFGVSSEEYFGFAVENRMEGKPGRESWS